MTNRRPLVAVMVAACGAAIAVGAFRPWVAASAGWPAADVVHTSLSALLHRTHRPSSPVTSAAAAVLGAGVLVLVGGVVASRLLAGTGALVALAVAGLWFDVNAGPGGRHVTDLRSGAWLALAGGLVAFVATFALRRRDRTAHVAPWESLAPLADDGDEGGDRPARRPGGGPDREGWGDLLPAEPRRGDAGGRPWPDRPRR